MGIVVTEVRKKSGAKIRVAFELEQNRQGSALPGRVNSSASSGNNSLIELLHARLICSAADILEELSLFSASNTQSGLKKIRLI